MKLRHLGYACTNVTLGCTSGRTLRLANLKEPRITEVIAENLATLLTLLRWNVAHDIRLFRVASSVIPLASHEAFSFDWQTAFAEQLAELRGYVRDNGLRLSMHPGQYTVLNSQRPEVVDKAVRELEYHAAFLAATDPEQGTMTLHVGGVYGDKREALAHFTRGFEKLSDEAKARLTLENDDRTYTAGEVVTLCETLGTPMIFDFWHHRLNPTAGTRETAFETGLEPLLERVVATWRGRVPKFHLSSGRGPGAPRTAHADYVAPEDLAEVTQALGSFGGNAPFDVMLEAKLKDVALLELREQASTG